jgi:hypothetical protein
MDLASSRLTKINHMKTIKRIPLILFLLACTWVHAQTAPGPKNTTIKVLSQQGDIFYFKAERKFIGAKVEVYDIHQQLICAEELPTRKMLIDFFEMEPGTYHIRLEKGNEVREFDYIKKGYTLVLNQVECPQE